MSDENFQRWNCYLEDPKIGILNWIPSFSIEIFIGRIAVMKFMIQSISINRDF